MTVDMTTLITSLCVGIALAAAAGMRIFLPLLLAGLAIRFDLTFLSQEGFLSQSWLGSDAALICFGAASITEALAYKVPFIDHFLDVIGAPAALIAGAVLASSFLVGIEDPLLKYGLGIIAGAGSAGIVHGAAAAGRVVSTATTGGIANPVFSISEFFGSLFMSIMAFLAPVFAVMVVLVLVIIIFILVRRYSRAYRED